MKRFAQLFTELDQTTKTNAKVEALARYFEEATEKDKLWTIALLSHRRPKRTVNTTLLREWAADYSGIPQWLFEESYHVVGDLAETIAAVLPPTEMRHEHSLSHWIEYVIDLKNLEEKDRREAVYHVWKGLDTTERMVFNKLITGSFRIGVSRKLMTRALALHTGIEENKLAHRLMGAWSPLDTSFQELIREPDPAEDISKPYPFYLAYALEGVPADLGAPDAWQAERKWDGIRGQMIIRDDQLFVWSRGEELVTDKFPEFHSLAEKIPNGTVLDGEIMPWKDGMALPFQLLQTRIGRKKLSKAILKKAPVVLIAYDLLEWQGKDLRERPLKDRRALLENLVSDVPANQPLLLSEALAFDSWTGLHMERDNARQHRAEGLMLKNLDSPYRSGRKKGDWWKWKVDPLSIDAVMIYAQRGHGRRANLFTDFTFAVWDGEDLVPFTKAYSGLTDKEFNEITHWVRRNTLERYGPVRAVKPKHVFEIHFEGIQRSSRHKSGVALRFPRMSRWRKDKVPEEANTLADLKQLLEVYGSGD